MYGCKFWKSSSRLGLTSSNEFKGTGTVSVVLIKFSNKTEGKNFQLNDEQRLLDL